MSLAADMQNGARLHDGAPDRQAAVPHEITRALELVHNPRTSNEQRAEASNYLEQLTSHDDAPYNGYLLASGRAHPAVVRHFGLSLLESAIRLRWMQYSSEEKGAVRDWVLKLAHSVDKSDAPYIRNKVAQLWVEIAKRSWALDWMDMDERLTELWSGSNVQKMLVLEVLETLSENSFGKEDAITALRGSDLNKACVEIFTPYHVIATHFPERDAAVDTRYGREGWLTRISDLLAWCLLQDQRDQDAQSCAARGLSALRSVASWVIPIALAETRCIERTCQLLMKGNCSTQLAAVEMLSALYARYSIQSEDVPALIGPLFQDATVDGLRRLYEWTIVDSENIDDEKYLLSKKFSEMLHNAGRYIKEASEQPFGTSNTADFLQLLLQVLRNDSLHVSIPALHIWVQILASPVSGAWEQTLACIAPLLEICSQRLIRWELLPTESNIPTINFLNEDIDTVPERHAFLGNYSRFCKDVVDGVVEKRPHEAFSYILSQANTSFHELLDSQPPLDAHSFSKTSMPALKVDAQCAVIEAGLQGYYRWRNTEKMKNGSHAEVNGQHSSMTDNIQSWCEQLMQMRFEDPSIWQRILHLIAEFTVNPLRKNGRFVTHFFEHLLETKARLITAPIPKGAHLYIEAVKELQRFCAQQLQRVAKRCPDILMEAFGEIEGAIRRYCEIPQVDEDDKERCIAVLMLIVQRASKLEDRERVERLEAYANSAVSKWKDPSLSRSLQSFDGFCDLLGLSQFSQYFLQRKAAQISDWSEIPLDEEGLALKARVDTAQQELPLRAIKTFFSATIDKTDETGQSNTISIELWSKYVPVMLPNLLQFISLAHLFSDPSSWTNVPPDTQTFVRRILKDRWWQVGISSGSRDDFYSKVEQSKTSLEGLASAIRGSLRFVRETCYKLLTTMAYLNAAVYDLADLPGPLSKAIFEHAAALSIHQNVVVIETVRVLIDRCPPESRERFLTPMLTAMFDCLDQKIRAEWEVIDQQNKGEGANGSLIDEMKNESVLRQLTYNCVTIVIRILDPHDSRAPVPPSTAPRPILRDFVLGTPAVFRSVVLFCTHALQMHDTRSCGLITRVLRSVVESFAATPSHPAPSAAAAPPTTPGTPPPPDPAIAADVREYLATDVLPAAITSLHDPYFVDAQADLAQLIAAVLRACHPHSAAPRRVLLMLRGLDEDAVDAALARVGAPGESARQQRAAVLQLLEGVRGVSVSELGRWPRVDRRQVGALQAEYMKVDRDDTRPRRQSPQLGGVADMFA